MTRAEKALGMGSIAKQVIPALGSVLLVVVGVLNPFDFDPSLTWAMIIVGSLHLLSVAWLYVWERRKQAQTQIRATNSEAGPELY